MDRIEADYLIETPVDPDSAVRVMAGEQSTGTFVAVPGETPELHERSGARVEHLEVLETRQAPSLSGGKSGEGYHRARVTLSWPRGNIGNDVVNLTATVAGNLFELQEFTGLKLLDIRLPDPFLAAYPGPKFGITGTRALSGVEQGALIGTIIKPSIGLNATETAQMVQNLCDAGIDFIKDDELQADGAVCPFEERAIEVMKVINAHHKKTGKKVMFAFNISGTIAQMAARHDMVHELGGNCVMVSLNAVGLAGLLWLNSYSKLPIHAHRNGWGALSRAEILGWEYPAWSKIWRLAGADHLHVNGLQNKFSEPDDSVVRSAKSVQTPLSDKHPHIAMPVFSSGQTVVQVGDTFERVGSADCIYAAGGGILAHPDGPKAGVIALRQAWDCAISGAERERFAETHPEFKTALKAFSK